MGDGLGTVSSCFQILARDRGWGEVAFAARVFAAPELLVGMQVSAEAQASSGKRLEMGQTTSCMKINNKCSEAGGWSSSFSQELLKAHFGSKCCRGRNASCLYGGSSEPSGMLLTLSISSHFSFYTGVEALEGP